MYRVLHVQGGPIKILLSSFWVALRSRKSVHPIYRYDLRNPGDFLLVNPVDVDKVSMQDHADGPLRSRLLC